jgi:hypothetical protein
MHPHSLPPFVVPETRVDSAAAPGRLDDERVDRHTDFACSIHEMRLQPRDLLTGRWGGSKQEKLVGSTRHFSFYERCNAHVTNVPLCHRILRLLSLFLALP